MLYLFKIKLYYVYLRYINDVIGYIYSKKVTVVKEINICDFTVTHFFVFFLCVCVVMPAKIYLFSMNSIQYDCMTCGPHTTH